MKTRSPKPRRSHLVAKLTRSFGLPQIVGHQTCDAEFLHGGEVEAIKSATAGEGFLMLPNRCLEDPWPALPHTSHNDCAYDKCVTRFTASGTPLNLNHEDPQSPH